MKKPLDLSTIDIEQVIVHTLPKHKKNDTDIFPKYSEEPSALTNGLRWFFKEKIVTALSSDKALRLSYDSSSTSPISAHSLTIFGTSLSKTVDISKKIAKHLFEVQNGTSNEGILVVIICTINQNRACVLIKLEMDTGAQLVLDSKKKSYDIQEIENLMLTKKTKIFKIALLLNKTTHNIKYDVLITDHQIDSKSKDEVKSWFINKFLGCIPFQDPKITTQLFYNLTKSYIETIDNDVKRAEYHQHLNSYLLKNSTTLNPKEFAEEYLSSTSERNEYKNFLSTKNFRFEAFTKDLHQIENKIRKITIEFTNDVTLIGNKGSFDKNVTFKKLDSGQTQVEIISRVRKVK